MRRGYDPRVSAAPPYELIDHTADTGIRVRGRTRADVFARAAWAFADLHTDATRVEPRERVAVAVEGLDAGDVLRRFLRELHYLYETRRLVLPHVTIGRLTARCCEATAAGETFDPARHEARGEIKAVTHHGLVVRREGRGWLAEVIFDL